MSEWQGHLLSCPGQLKRFQQKVKIWEEGTSIFSFYWHWFQCFENYLYDVLVAKSKLKVGICKLGKVWISGGKALTYSRHLASATLEVWQNLGQHKLYNYSDNKTKQKTLFDKIADSKNTKHKHNTRQLSKIVKNTNCAEEPDLFSADVSGWVKQPSDLKYDSKFPFS